MALDESTFEGECWRVVVLALCVFLLFWWLAKLSWFGGWGNTCLTRWQLLEYLLNSLYRAAGYGHTRIVSILLDDHTGLIQII